MPRLKGEMDATNGSRRRGIIGRITMLYRKICYNAVGTRRCRVRCFYEGKNNTADAFQDFPVQHLLLFYLTFTLFAALHAP